MPDFSPAARVSRIKSSPSVAAAARVRELKAEGRRILDLTVGEPDFDTPPHIKAAAVAAIEAGETKYTSVTGTPVLQKAILGRLEHHTGVRFEPDQITIGGGAKQVIFLALMATLDAGRRGHHPGPVLGVLPGHGPGQRRHARHRPLRARRPASNSRRRPCAAPSRRAPSG